MIDQLARFDSQGYFRSTNKPTEWRVLFWSVFFRALFPDLQGWLADKFMARHVQGSGDLAEDLESAFSRELKIDAAAAHALQEQFWSWLETDWYRYNNNAPTIVDLTDEFHITGQPWQGWERIFTNLKRPTAIYTRIQPDGVLVFLPPGEYKEGDLQMEPALTPVSKPDTMALALTNRFLANHLDGSTRENQLAHLAMNFGTAEQSNVNGIPYPYLEGWAKGFAAWLENVWFEKTTQEPSFDDLKKMTQMEGRLGGYDRWPQILKRKQSAVAPATTPSSLARRPSPPRSGSSSSPPRDDGPPPSGPSAYELKNQAEEIVLDPNDVAAFEMARDAFWEENEKRLELAVEQHKKERDVVIDNYLEAKEKLEREKKAALDNLDKVHETRTKQLEKDFFAFQIQEKNRLNAERAKALAAERAEQERLDAERAERERRDAERAARMQPAEKQQTEEEERLRKKSSAVVDPVERMFGSKENVLKVRKALTRLDKNSFSIRFSNYADPEIRAKMILRALATKLQENPNAKIDDLDVLMPVFDGGYVWQYIIDDLPNISLTESRIAFMGCAACSNPKAKTKSGCCGSLRYCGQSCADRHWSAHKNTCGGKGGAKQ